MLDKLKQPFVKPYHSAKNRLSVFVNPIKGAVLNLWGKLPSVKAMAGSEEGGELSPETAPGLLGRLKSFKKSLKGMSDLQKLILVTIAVCLPAGILIAVTLAAFFRRNKKE